MNAYLKLSAQDLESSVLAHITRIHRERDDHCTIEQVASLLYPSPAFTPEDIDAWREKHSQWDSEYYGGRNGIKYSDSVCSHVAQAFIRLTKARKIREHITGHGFSTYSLS